MSSEIHPAARTFSFSPWTQTMRSSVQEHERRVTSMQPGVSLKNLNMHEVRNELAWRRRRNPDGFWSRHSKGFGAQNRLVSERGGALARAIVQQDAGNAAIDCTATAHWACRMDFILFAFCALYVLRIRRISAAKHGGGRVLSCTDTDYNRNI